MDAAVEKLLELDVVKNTDKILLSMEKTLRTLRYRILQVPKEIKKILFG